MSYENVLLWIREIPDRLKTHEMCDAGVHMEPRSLEFVPGQIWPVPDQYKTQEMCDKAVEEDLCLLEYVPDWFVKEQHIEVWSDDVDYYYDDKLIEWYEDY